MLWRIWELQVGSDAVDMGSIEETIESCEMCR